jgi:hypothetical protein
MRKSISRLKPVRADFGIVMSMNRFFSPWVRRAFLIAGLSLLPASAIAARLVFLEKFGYPT